MKKKIEDVLAKLHLDKKTGPFEGGNAKVYICRNQKGEEVALKYLRSQKEEAEIRFKREIKFLKNVDKNLKIIPLIETDGESWYTMPVAKPIMECTKGKDAEKILKIVYPLCGTLAKLHAQGISHRDIKPDNIYWYNGSCCLGDFGLLKDEHNPGNLTTDERGVGALFTVAPEMQRYPKEADPYKGDVYSIAKTLWMLLTREEKGFDGTYDGAKDKVGFRFFKHLANEYLAQIEILMSNATSTDPDNRPNMVDFLNTLSLAIRIMKNPGYAQLLEWRYIRDLVAPGLKARTIVWTDLDEIIRVLNFVGRAKAANHMMFAGGGGLDFTRIERAGEDSCLKMYVQGSLVYIFKPKALHYECFEKTNWNYFLLDLDILTPKYANQDADEEELVEETPGNYHYVGDADVYGVYDYDKGDSVPPGAQVVSRMTSGRFLIVLKSSPYNYATDTYDGRHACCSPAEFREYMDNCCENGFEQVDCSFRPEEPVTSSSAEEEFELESKADEIIRNTYKDWILPQVDSNVRPADNIAKYVFEFIPPFCLDDFSIDNDDTQSYYIGKDGRIAQMDVVDAYVVYGKESAEFQFVKYAEFIGSKVGFKCLGSITGCLRIHVLRDGPVKHQFTKADVIQLIRDADDRTPNQLVVDVDGCMKMVNPHDTQIIPYAVILTPYMSRHRYVGKYADLNGRKEYQQLLAKWWYYLTYNQPLRVYDECLWWDEEELEKKLAELEQKIN